MKDTAAVARVSRLYHHQDNELGEIELPTKCVANKVDSRIKERWRWSIHKGSLAEA